MGDAEALEFPAQASLTRRLWQGKSDAAVPAFLPLWACHAVPLIRGLPASTLIDTLVAGVSAAIAKQLAARAAGQGRLDRHSK